MRLSITCRSAWSVAAGQPPARSARAPTVDGYQPRHIVVLTDLWLGSVATTRPLRPAASVTKSSPSTSDVAVPSRSAVPAMGACTDHNTRAACVENCLWRRRSSQDAAPSAQAATAERSNRSVPARSAGGWTQCRPTSPASAGSAATATSSAISRSTSARTATP